MKFLSIVSTLFAAQLSLGYASNPTGCLDPSQVSSETDYFPDKVDALSSEFWDISYHNTYKILRNEIQDASYLLYQCGTEPPADELNNHDAVISIPIQNVAITQTTMIPHLELLGLRSSIKGYLGYAEYVSSPCLNDLINDGTVQVIQNTSDPVAINELLSTAQDLVAFKTEFDSIVDIPNQVFISEYSESTNAGTYEWNKYYAAFFNLESLANQLYDEVVDRYECIAENAAVTETDMEQPVVLWAYYSTFSNGWDVAECPNYFCEFAEICSADILNSREGSGPVQGEVNKLQTLEEFIEFGKDADYWIFNSYDWDMIYAENKEALDQFKSVQNQQVYDYQGVGQNSWFEQRLVEFDVVAQDFCAVVGTQPRNPFHQRVYFRNVFTEQVGTAGVCLDANAPLETRATECTLIAPQPGGTSSATKTTAWLLMSIGAIVGSAIAFL